MKPSPMNFTPTDTILKRTLDIQAKSQLDNDDQAADRFDALLEEFDQWCREYRPVAVE